MHSLLNDRNYSLRTQFSRKNQTQESEIYRYIAKLLPRVGFPAVPHLGVEVAIESQTRLGLLNKRVDQITGRGSGSIAMIHGAEMIRNVFRSSNSLSEISRQFANSKTQETIPVLVPLRLLLAAQIELIAHDKTPNLFVRLGVGNFKTDLQRINTKRRFWRQCKK